MLPLTPALKDYSSTINWKFEEYEKKKKKATYFKTGFAADEKFAAKSKTPR